MADRPTVGYVGIDHHHTAPYLESLATLPVDLIAVCEPNESIPFDSVRGISEVQQFREYEVFLDEIGPDIIWVTLSNRDTPAVIHKALQRDIDVYSEKPGARTARELQPLVELERERDVTVGISYPWRSHPAAVRLREFAREGAFGQVRSVAGRFNASQVRFRDTDHYLFDNEASRGGILQWLGVHWVDLLPWILDDLIVRVCAVMDEDATVDVEDSASVQCEFESGASGTLSCGYYLRKGRYDTLLHITGMGGRAVWDPMGDYFGFDEETTLEYESTAKADAPAPRNYVTYSYEPTPGYGGEFGRQFMKQFLDARASSQVAVPAGLSDALRVLRVLDAAYESADSGSWVEVDRTE